MKDVMIDLETMGNTWNAPIIQFGGVYFDRYTGELGEELKLNIDLEDALSIGTKVDGSTVKWWLQQSSGARNSILKRGITVVPALSEILKFLHKSKYIWSHATFDFVILQNHLTKCNFENIHYRKAKDIRTLTNLAGLSTEDIKKDSLGIAHDALDDCKFQIKYCVKCFNILKREN